MTSKGGIGTVTQTPRLPGRAVGNIMRAAVVAAAGEIEIQELACPVPGPTQVRVRLEGCGVCASNIPVWQGRPWFHYPFEPGAPGHEGWGIVDAVGPGVRSVSRGDRVAVLSSHAYADYDVADAADVVRLPAELDGVPFPGEPLGCAMNVLQRSDLAAGQVVAILGIGFLGALLTRLAKNAGCRVVAVSRRPCALEAARQFGADEVATLGDRHDVAREILAITGGAGCERVVEAAGHQEMLDLATDIVGVRGKLIIAGYHQDGLRQVNMQRWNWQGVDVINAHERDPRTYIDGIQRAVQAVSDGRLDPQPLLTHFFRLEELSVALDHAVARPTGFMKAVVLMGEPRR